MGKKEKSNIFERLLNIREAAEFLNVSQMTVRRWTNEGSFHYYRIGGNGRDASPSGIFKISLWV